MSSFSKYELPTPDRALPGRDIALAVTAGHYVHQHPVKPPFPDNCQVIYLGMGCFWGAERLFWKKPGVWTTAVGYAGGFTPNPTYEEVCSGGTGHAEVVMVVFDPEIISPEQLLAMFWESHDPTQGMRQGNDTGTQYRSVIYTTNDEQMARAQATRLAYQQALTLAGQGEITTEVQSAPVFYYAEEYHQQYLAKNINGYCGISGVGVCMPPA